MIADYLKTGRDNPTTSAELCKRTGMTPFELRIAIMNERRGGQPICAASGSKPGYFLAADRDEMQNFCESLRHRAGEIFKTRAACLEQINTLPERSGTNK